MTFFYKKRKVLLHKYLRRHIKGEKNLNYYIIYLKKNYFFL